MKYITVWSIGAQKPNETYIQVDNIQTARLLGLGAIVESIEAELGEASDIKVELVETGNIAARQRGRPKK